MTKLWAKKRKTDQKDDDDEAKKKPIASTAGTKIMIRANQKGPKRPKSVQNILSLYESPEDPFEI